MKKQVLKTLLKKKMIEESFYGILGILPNASLSEIESSFKRSLKDELSLEKIQSILKAYSILSSSYKKQYDEYLTKFDEGIETLVEQVDNEDELIDLLKISVDSNTLPDGIFMQPWATTI